MKDEVLTATCKDGSGSEALGPADILVTIAVDSSGVYWTDRNKVMKIAK